MKKVLKYSSIIFILAGILILENISSSICFAKTKFNPNILLVTIDTIRPDRLSCYSRKYLETPNIENLAKRGAIFTRAFAHAPLTLPSHTSILLGLTPPSHGVHDNSRFVVNEDFITLAEYLKEKGYSTGAFIGAFPLDSRFGLAQGFDVYDDNYGTESPRKFAFIERKAEKVIKLALNWLNKQNSKWFCWIHLWDPHQPYSPPEPFKTKFKNDLYSGEVAYVDAELGKVFNYLKNHKLINKTLIILTGDHGESLGEHGESTHGYFAYNSTIWVPLIIAGPGIKAAQITEYVSHIDIFPTICDILKEKKPSFLEGASLLPLINGKKIKKRAIYFESLHAYYNRGWAPLKGFIKERKKFIDSPIPEFYDLESDFGEKNNIVSKINLSKYQKELKKIEKKFSSFHKTQIAEKVSRETREKLMSLGYLSSPSSPSKHNFGPEDDLKILLPFQNMLTRAMAFYNSGKIDEAVKLLTELIRNREDFDLAYCRLAEIYKSQGKLKKAIDILEKGFNTNPQSYFIISDYGILLAEAGKTDKAIKIIKRGLSLWNYDAELWNYLGVAYWRKGDYREALKAYERALSLDNNYPKVFNNLGSLYLSIFIKNRKKELLNRSIKYFNKAIELDPNLASAYNGLGSAYKIMGRVDDAISCWKKSIELKPDYDFPIYNLGVTYLEKNNKNEALKYLEKYLSLKGDSLPPSEYQKLKKLIQNLKRK